MGLFSSKPKQTDVELLSEKSKNIVGVFTKTAQDLQAVNDEIRTSKEEKVNTITQLQGEVEVLDSISDKNSNIIGRIQKILE